MYSRYVPDGRGGYARKPMPSEPPRPPREPPEPPAPHAGFRPGTGGPPPGPQAVFQPPPPNHGPMNGFPPGPPPRPPQAQWPRPSHSGRPRPIPPGPGRLLQGLLGRSLDLDDLLILAVLVLALRADGADGLTVALAAGLYLML